jgi:hypothetical protein
MRDMHGSQTSFALPSLLHRPRRPQRHRGRRQGWEVADLVHSFGGAAHALYDLKDSFRARRQAWERGPPDSEV